MEEAAPPDRAASSPKTLGLLASWRGKLFGRHRLSPILGTDSLGRGLFSRLIHGARFSLLVGLLASAVSLLVGVLYGALAGLAGGRLEALMMRGVDLLYALPLMFLAIFVVSLLRGVQAARPDFPLGSGAALFIVIGAVSWLEMARLVRARVQSLKTAPFMEAARAEGAGPGTLLFRHLLPNLLPLIVVTLTLTVPRVILMEAFLSFLGLGVDAPDISWGLLVKEGLGAVSAVHVTWWLLVFPGLFLGGTLLAINTLGDGLRDLLDPHLRGLLAHDR